MLEQLLSFAARYGSCAVVVVIACYFIFRWLSKQKISIHIGNNSNGNGKVNTEISSTDALTREELSEHCRRLHEPIWTDIKRNYEAQLTRLGEIGEAVARIDERTRRL